MITLFSSTKFPDFFSVYIIYPLNAMSNSKFAELRVQKSAPWLRQKKNADILGAWWGIAYKSRCRFLHLDLGNTEVVPWDLGDCRCQGLSGCRKLHVDIVNSLTITHRIQVLPYMVTFTINIHQMLAYIYTIHGSYGLYYTMIFPAMDSGSFIWDLGKKKIMPIFWLGGAQIHRPRKSVA